MVRAVPAEQVTAIVNVGDDMWLHGLYISPDIDTVVYTVAGAIDPERGWGLKDETWRAMEALRRYGGESWFNLGDQDLATHLYRTQRIAEGAALSHVTTEVAASWGLAMKILPVTDEPMPTMITLAATDREPEQEVSFQEYFVKRQHADPVSAVRSAGAADARPAPGVLDALARAGRVVIAPSNPIVSIGPLLAVPGVRDAVEARREDTVAVSPLVGGKALKGPADHMMVELGHDDSVAGIARLYAPLAATLVIDEADAKNAAAVEAEGMRCVVTDTIMRDPSAAAKLSRTLLA